jgi:hypothetical protein
MSDTDSAMTCSAQNARNARIFARLPTDKMESADAQGNHEQAWRSWIHHEYLSRSVNISLHDWLEPDR